MACLIRTERSGKFLRWTEGGGKRRKKKPATGKQLALLFFHGLVFPFSHNEFGKPAHGGWSETSGVLKKEEILLRGSSLLLLLGCLRTLYYQCICMAWL